VIRIPIPALVWVRLSSTRPKEFKSMTEITHQSGTEQQTWGRWLLILVGVLSIAAGLAILFKPSDSLPTLAVIAGTFLLVDGILELASSRMRGTQNRGLAAVFGILTAIVGVLLIRHPVGGVAPRARRFSWLGLGRRFTRSALDPFMTPGAQRLVLNFDVGEGGAVLKAS
jgi:hypothetical protein